MRVEEYKRRTPKTMDSTKKDELLKKMKKEHQKLVKGMFEFTEAQGGWFDFAYRYFPDDLLVTYHLIHGETTEIPMGVVRHLNNTMKKIRTFAKEQAEGGTKVSYGPMEKISRVRFIRMDDIEAPQYGT